MKKILVTLLTVCSLASAQATLFQYHAIMDGPSEAPANASPGTGTAFVDYDNVAKTLFISASFSGLVANTTAAHIHAATASPLTGTAGVAVHSPSLAGFPLGVTSGSYSQSYDLTLTSSYSSAYLTANGGTAASAEVALANHLATGRAYFNIHSQTFPGGEIRGFLVPVPEPSSVALIGLFAAGLACYRRTRKA